MCAPRRYVLELILVLVALFWAVALIRAHGFFLTHFEEANILRAQRLLAGHFEIWGPETDAGVRLPGPFFTLLLAVPTWLGGWEATTTALALALGLTIALATLLVNRHAGFWPAVLASAALAVLPTLNGEILRNWNPSFAIPMGLLAFVIGLRTQEVPGARRWWLLWGLTVSCGVQVHAALAAYYVAAVWTLREEPVGKRGAVALAFLLGAVAPLLPALLAGADFGALLTGFLFVRHYLSFGITAGFGERLLGDLLPALVPALPLLYAGVVRPLSRIERTAWIFTACQLPAAWIYLSTDYGERNVTGFVCCLVLAICLIRRANAGAIGQALFAGASLLFFLRIENVRETFYAGMFGGIAGSVLAAALGAAIILGARGWPRVAWRAVPCAVALLVMALYPHWFTGGFHYPALLRIGELRRLGAEIRLRTGWSYLDYRWRILRFGVNGHTGFQLTYPDSAGAAVPAAPAPVAYALVWNVRNEAPEARDTLRIFGQAGSTAPHLPLERLGVAPQLQEAFCSSENRLCAVPLRAIGPAMPELLNNTGVTYLGEAMPYAAELANPGESGVTPLAGGGALFAWRDCAVPGLPCRTAMTAIPVGRGALRISILGNSLGFVSRQLSPSWNEIWEEPYIEVVCAGRRRLIPLLPKIGVIYSRSDIEVLAPYQVVVSSGCEPGHLEEITAGRKGAEVFQSTQAAPVVTYGEGRLSWKPEKPL